jgi:hypothetical protein
LPRFRDEPELLHHAQNALRMVAPNCSAPSMPRMSPVVGSWPTKSGA